MTSYYRCHSKCTCALVSRVQMSGMTPWKLLNWIVNLRLYADPSIVQIGSQIESDSHEINMKMFANIPCIAKFPSQNSFAIYEL